MTTPYIGRPSADWPITSTVMRPFDCAAIESSVHPIA